MSSQMMWQTILIGIIVAVLCTSAFLMLVSIFASHASHGAMMIIAHPTRVEEYCEY